MSTLNKELFVFLLIPFTEPKIIHLLVDAVCEEGSSNYRDCLGEVCDKRNFITGKGGSIF